jgi:Arc/MetJ family transcription regulator
MSRTNIEIDDRKVAKVMELYGLRSKREAVDFALHRLVGNPMSREEILAMRGTGWEGDLDELRGSYEPWSEPD